MQILRNGSAKTIAVSVTGKEYREILDSPFFQRSTYFVYVTDVNEFVIRAQPKTLNRIIDFLSME